MIAAIQSGFNSITDVQQKSTAASIASCGGTKCVFGQYQSLAVCGACSANTLPVSNTAGGYYTLNDLPNVDLSLSASDGLLNITADTEYPISDDLNDKVGPLIVRMLAIARNGGTSSPAIGMECASWWCVATVRNR